VLLLYLLWSSFGIRYIGWILFASEPILRFILGFVFGLCLPFWELRLSAFHNSVITFSIEELHYAALLSNDLEDDGS
jgi:hypothetical protein